MRNEDLSRIFSIPPNVIPLAYLCIGYVPDFQPLTAWDEAERKRRS